MEKDYLKLLDEVIIQYQEIVYFQNNVYKNETRLQVMIKQFTGNIQSVLDYTMFYLFEKVYLPKYESEGMDSNTIEKKSKKVSFININDSNKFNESLDCKLPNLKLLYPEIYQVIYDVQPFNFDGEQKPWLSTANKMANDFKHRKLATVDSRENAHIKHMVLPGNNVFNNISITGTKNAVVINGKPLTKSNSKSLGVQNFNGTIETYYVFEENNEPINQILSNLLENLKITVNKLDTLFDKYL